MARLTAVRDLVTGRVFSAWLLNFAEAGVTGMGATHVADARVDGTFRTAWLVAGRWTLA